MSLTPEEIKKSLDTMWLLLKSAKNVAKIFSLQDHHLLDGLEKSNLFIDRLIGEHLTEKLNLARAAYDEFLVQSDIHRPHQYFFESGSAIAHILGHLVTKIAANEPPKFSAITNNLVGLTALANLCEDIQSIKGRFDPKYFALLPFKEDPTHDEAAGETHDFLALESEISNCDCVFAACSSFSFIFGPLVGTRANAMTKRAMYEGRMNSPTQQFVLAFQVQKVVPLSDPHSVLAMRPHGLNCFNIFAPPEQGLLAKMSDQWLKEFAKEARTGIPTSTNLDWHREYLAELKAPVQDLSEFSKAYGHQKACLKRPSLVTSWLEIAPLVELLVGLPNDKEESLERDFLQKEVTWANAILTSAAVAKEYELDFKGAAAIVRCKWK